MALHLNSDQANSKIAAIDAASGDVCHKLAQMRDHQQHMLASGWRGNAAQGYDISSQKAADDYNRCIAFLTRLCETAKTNVGQLVSAETSA